MKKLLMVMTACSVLTGCSTLDTFSLSDEQIMKRESVIQVNNDMPVGSEQISRSVEFKNTYRQNLLGINDGSGGYAMSENDNKSINFYAKRMMQDLVGNLRFVNASTPIAVTNFVFLDSDFEQADLIGMQLSESFIHEVHRFGIPVIDFKTTDYVRVSRSGDFVLSKDYLELNGELPIKYVLAGTLTKNVAGYSVNARIIGINSKAVVASAQGFIPESVISRVMSSNMNDGLPIMSRNY